MSPFPNGSQRFPTVQEVDAWLLAAQERRAQLHCHAASPCGSDERQEAFTAMSDLLLEAFEEVRIMSESTREESQVVRGEAMALRAHNTRLREQGAALWQRMAQFLPPAPEEIRQVESRILEMFKETPPQKPR
jgi:hypothetical protein